MGWIYHSSKNSEGKHQMLYKFGYHAKAIVIPSGVHVIKGKKPTANQKVKLTTIEGIILKSIQEAKEKIPPYSAPKLKHIIENKILGRTVQDGEVRIKLKTAWLERIQDFHKVQKWDSKRHNQDSMKAVLSVMNNYYIDEITPEILTSLKNALLSKTKKNDEPLSPASVAGYLRDLRALIISIVGRNRSPFIGVTLPRSPKKRNVALTWEEFQLFKNTPLNGSFYELTRDMFVFRYYCLGMRIKDQLLLKPSQIVNGRLTYTTHKTKKTFDFQLPDECIEIIEKYKGGRYVFPLMGNYTGEQKSKRIKDVISKMKKTLQTIADRLGINKTISTHAARHTFAFINQDKGIGFIQKSFDHGSITTTEGYIESLSNQDSLIDQMKK